MNKCYVPKNNFDTVQLAHGSGGKLTLELLNDLIFPLLNNQSINSRHDGATVPRFKNNPVITTDSYVIDPLFFPNSNIGELAINGTANDLAVCGAKPRYFSLGLIIEEGLKISLLTTIIESIGKTLTRVDGQIITGDTKVVERGQADGIFINTTGIGELQTAHPINSQNLTPGDEIIVDGPVGDHGIAVLSRRENLGFDSQIISDTRSLWPEVETLLNSSIKVHCLRDLTRGGLATNLLELIQTKKTVGACMDSWKIPVKEEVKAACEILGIDPLYVACEGRMVIIVPAGQGDQTVEVLNARQDSPGACKIGRITDDDPGNLTIKEPLGTTRFLRLKSGEQLPRIC